MTENTTTDPTRRDTIKYGGTLLAGGALAGCADDADTGDGETTEDGSYTVEMAPVGEVEFEEVPERWLPYTADYADMGVALGQADGLAGIGLKSRYSSQLYEELPGVSVDKSDLTALWDDGTGKEVFYEVDADVHVMDPNFLINRLRLSEDDVEEIRDTAAPFVGNTIFSRVYDWHDYRYYSMYEAFEKLATLFQARDRYEAFKSYHDEILADAQGRLPAETPDVAVLFPAGVPPDSFYPYLIKQGTQSKHWRDLGVGDALGANGVTDAQAGGGTIDYEQLLDIDPDVIAVRYTGSVGQSWVDENVLPHMRDHPVASELQAVQNDRVIYGGVTYQGPIIHLFQLEMAAQALYPGEFGDDPLFDRQRVADIVTSDL
jgi:iron complex transport system substrate-binding protein